jgi:hypothetical protein
MNWHVTCLSYDMISTLANAKGVNVKQMVSLLVGILLLGVLPASAGIYSFQPYDADLGDLDHYKAYSWRINWSHTSERITAATLKFKNIYDWTSESNDILWVNLLNSPPTGYHGINVYTDNQGSTNYFAGWDGALVGTWTDPVGGLPADNVTFSIGGGLLETLNTYAADGVFGFGLDPDCHYYNCGVSLQIETSAVPEPASLLLFGMGLTALGATARRKQ